MDIVKTCVVCGKQHVIRVNQDGYAAWRNGMLIQQALPNLSEEDREMLISGMCGKCWHEMCGMVDSIEWPDNDEPVETKAVLITGKTYAAYVMLNDAVIVYNLKKFATSVEALKALSDPTGLSCYEGDFLDNYGVDFYDLVDGCPYYLHLISKHDSEPELTKIAFEITWVLMHANDEVLPTEILVAD